MQDDHFHGLMLEFESHPDFYPADQPNQRTPQHVIDKRYSELGLTLNTSSAFTKLPH